MDIRKEDYIGYEDQELCSKYYKEAEVLRQAKDYPRLRAMSTPPSPSSFVCRGQLGTRPGTGVRYVNTGMAGGDRL